MQHHERLGLLEQVRNGIGGLVLVCIGLRVGAWLIAPVLPLLIGSFVMVLLWGGISQRHHH